MSYADSMKAKAKCQAEMDQEYPILAQHVIYLATVENSPEDRDLDDEAFEKLIEYHANVELDHCRWSQDRKRDLDEILTRVNLILAKSAGII